jgi:hypothetical protein
MEARTMAVVAEFDISIEAINVVNINPMSRFLGFVPDTFSVNLKRASSNFVLVMAAARKKPPSNSQITLLENVFTYGATFSGEALKYLFPSENTRYAIIKRLTANGGMASVSHNPMEKNNRKITYNCELVKPGSLRINVRTNAMINDAKKEIIDFFCFDFSINI